MIVIAANLGHLKAYRAIETPNRGKKLELLEELNFPEAHGHYTDKVSDMAGRFPKSEGAGPSTGMSTAETLKAGLEIQRRLTHLVAETIESILIRERPEWWDFAAASEIHQAILEELPPQLRDRLLHTAHADLTKSQAEEVASHFFPAPKPM